MSPQAFDDCVKNEGRVRTRTISGGRYQHICFLHGKSYAGEVKTKQNKSNPGAAVVRMAGRK